MQLIDTALLESLTGKAKTSPRKRMNFNLHASLEDPVQRLFNAIEPGTYIRAHRHADPETFELFLMLRGSAVLLFFDDSGYVVERTDLSAQGPLFGVEIPPQTWHAMASREDGTIFFEVKKGPYVTPSGSNVASWAPAEGEKRAADFVAWYLNARIGDGPPLVIPG
jgi:cupin fold WbuC family metalloprotein